MKRRSSTQDIEQPLLVTGDERCETLVAGVQRDTFWPCAMNLAKAVTGAGMMAIPRAYQQIGSLLGTAMLLGVAVLTYFTLAVLIHGSATTRASTYSQLVFTTCGQFATKVLQLSVLSFCFGFSVVYLVVIRDILLGSPPACSGLLCEVFGLDPTGPLANPEIVIAAVAVFICAPLLLMRSMDSLAFLNAVGVAAVVLLAAVAACLGAQAVATGTAYAIPIFPQWESLGPTRALQFEALADVLPVILACYVAHQNLHPLMPILKPYTPGRMCGVVAVALSIAALVFAALAVGSALAFGPSLEVNVLNNFSEDDLSPLVGQRVAEALSWVTRGAYLVAVLGSLLLYMHPLRSILAEVLWGSDAAQAEEAGRPCRAACTKNVVAAAAPSCAASATDTATHLSHNLSWEIGSLDAAVVALSAPQDERMAADSTAYEMAPVVPGCAAFLSQGSVPMEKQDTPVQQQPRWQQLEQKWCYVLTYSLLLAMVLTAIIVPSIWSALSAIGDLSSTTQAFMIPGCVAISLAFKYRLNGAAGSAAGQCPEHGAVNGVGGCGSSNAPLRTSDNAYAAMRPHEADQQTLDNALQPRHAHGRCFQCMRSKQQCLVGFAALPCGHSCTAATVLYVAAAGDVVLLGLALFANGVWQRV